MGIVLGVDIGGSMTKIVGRSDETLIGMLQAEAAGQGTTLRDGIDRFLRYHNLELSAVSAIYLTGAGSSFIDEQVYGIKTHKVSEFEAIGTGALRLSGVREALVVSMGTGTAFIRATSEGNVHIGGTGVGGGTILGLTSQLTCGRCVDEILALAQTGDLNNVDLFVGDIVNQELDTLPSDMTASNFGKLRESASDSDYALGIINMVFEAIGVMALFALRNDTIKNIVLTGMLATFPQAKPVFGKVARLADKKFIICPDAVFATALGALPN